jgi:hypothetical protein
MGNFSYSCGVCSQEVLHGHIPGYSKFKQAIVMWSNGDRMSGEYDGYGRIGGGPDLVDQMGDWKVVHQCCYNNQPYEEMKHGPHNAPNQGFWPGERMAVVLYGEPDLSEFKSESPYACKVCLKTWKAKWSGGVCPFGCVRPKSYESYEELVEPFRWLNGRYDHADGLVICRNKSYEVPDWDVRRAASLLANPEAMKEIDCFFANRVEQARVTEPEEWGEDLYGEGIKPFKVVCTGCNSAEHLEILTLSTGNVPAG